jgi:thiamine pyrophosphate-dependent acetolactate synthase large subunit-like protein
MDIAEKPAAAGGNEIDRPVPSAPSNRVWGSDAIAAMLRELDIPYIALNPGASYRGIHDSLVNYLGNTRPRMLLCLHEESAVALAHGYAKVTGRPMAAFVHSNVGLMHATMAIFNAWCDRAPVLVLGATGPMDSTRRRPWIEWIHTARDQGALIRNFIKWDDQPASIGSAQEAILRAWMIANTAPQGPVYVNFDLALQEDEITELPPPPDLARHTPPVAPEPSGPLVQQAAALLAGARRPVILAGRGSRDPEAWQRRVALAEAIGARVITDRKSGATFPTDHPLHVASTAAVADADVILSLDWVDLAGTLRTAHAGKPVTAKVVQVSVDQYVHNGWSMDYQGLPPVDVYMMCEPNAVVPLLLSNVKARAAAVVSKPPALPDASDMVTIRTLADALNAATKGMDVCMTRLPLGWNGAYRHFNHPLDYIGSEGGGGVGAGPGITVGAALALKGSGRLPVAIMGDGDFLMGNTALWTAAHYGIPCLILVANNRSFFNDELHQERVAKERGRPVENRWIGQRISGPDIDIAMMARAQGTEGIGPVTQVAELLPAIEKGLRLVQDGAVCVVDVRVAPGYDTNMAGSGASQKR